MDLSTLTLEQLYEQYRANRALIKTTQEAQLRVHLEITRREHATPIVPTDKDQRVKA